jgi:hypothetical protein
MREGGAFVADTSKVTVETLQHLLAAFNAMISTR